MLKRSLITFASIAGILAATPALAEPITLNSSNVGDEFTLSYDGFADGSTIDNLTSEATFTLLSVDSDTFTFAYELTNTSSDPISSRVSSFSFNTNPDILSADSTGTFGFVQTDSNYPNGIGSVDVCFKGGFSGACSGNKGGVNTGDTGTGTLTLNFDGPISSLTLDDFFVRYQSITGAGSVGSASGQGTLTGSTSGGTTTSSGGTTTSSGGTSGTPVPAPGALGILGLGLIGFAAMRRRQRPAAA